MKDINSILDSIKEQTELFLKNNASTKIIQTTTTTTDIYKNSSLINLTYIDMNFKILLSIDDNLLQIILRQLLKDDIEHYDNSDILKDLIDEVINIIVGLSIQNFSLKYKDFTLGVPYKISQTELMNKIKNIKYKSFKIATLDGILICYIFKD